MKKFNAKSRKDNTLRLVEINQEPKEAQMSELDKQLQRELIKLSCGTTNYSRFDEYTVTEEETWVTEEDEETGEETVLGFGVADGEAIMKEEKYKADLHFAKAHLASNKELYKRRFKGVDFSKVDAEVLVSMTMQILDSQTDGKGHNRKMPDVRVNVKRFLDKYNKWVNVKKADYFTKYKFGGKTYPVSEKMPTGKVKDGKPVMVNTPFQFTRELDDIFEMDDAGFPISIKESTMTIKDLKQLDNGKYETVNRVVCADVLTAALRPIGIRLGRGFKIEVSAPNLHQMVEFNPTGRYEFHKETGTVIESSWEDRNVYEEHFKGVELLQPSYDTNIADWLRRQDSKEIQFGQANQVSSWVSHDEGAWAERKELMDAEAEADVYANRKVAGDVAKKARISQYYQDVLDNNAAEVSLVEALIEMEVSDAADFAEGYDNPRLLAKVAKAYNRVNGSGLDKKVMSALLSHKVEAQKIECSDLINALNNADTKKKALLELKALSNEKRISVILDVLEVAKRNLSTFKENKENGVTATREESGVLDYKVFKLLDNAAKTFGKLA